MKLSRVLHGFGYVASVVMSVISVFVVMSVLNDMHGSEDRIFMVYIASIFLVAMKICLGYHIVIGYGIDLKKKSISFRNYIQKTLIKQLVILCVITLVMYISMCLTLFLYQSDWLKLIIIIVGVDIVASWIYISIIIRGLIYRRGFRTENPLVQYFTFYPLVVIFPVHELVHLLVAVSLSCFFIWDCYRMVRNNFLPFPINKLDGIELGKVYCREKKSKVLFFKGLKAAIAFRDNDITNEELITYKIFLDGVTSLDNIEEEQLAYVCYVTNENDWQRSIDENQLSIATFKNVIILGNPPFDGHEISDEVTINAVNDLFI